MSKQYIAPSVKKAFDILKVVASSEQGMGISQIARDLGMAKSTVHGLTSALAGLGAVSRDPKSKKYRAGLTLLELGKSAYSQVDLKDLARPVMEDLMEKTRESVFLGVLNGEHVTVIDIVESRNDLKITSPVGTALPLLAGAIGKAFLSCLDEERARETINKKGLVRYTENTITDPGEYIQEIREVKKRGYATDYEEYIPGVHAVVCPITGERHRLSAVWVVGFKASLDKDRMASVIQETKTAAYIIEGVLRKRSIG